MALLLYVAGAASCCSCKVLSKGCAQRLQARPCAAFRVVCCCGSKAFVCTAAVGQQGMLGGQQFRPFSQAWRAAAGLIAF
ncbi:hypothetical protein UB43_17085 [Pseudomonas sp. 21]|nr:hypothetical protein UB43_17085 [Pseudomonas sp. 21]